MQATGAAVIQMTERIAGSLRVVWISGKAEVPRIGGILSGVYRGSEIRLIPGPGDFVRVQLTPTLVSARVELREFGNSTIMRTQPSLAEGCVSG